jgi:Arc/MetJ-type ribon-helix-helix transcriptional regulator
MALILTTEQEAILERSVREGRFVSTDAALNAAVSSLAKEEILSEEEKRRRAHIRSKSLYELMQESPLYGNEVEFERDRSPLRDIEL